SPISSFTQRPVQHGRRSPPWLEGCRCWRAGLKCRSCTPISATGMAPGFRMLLSKIGPSAALAFAGTALLLLAVGPLGWRLGWWQYGFALYRLMPLSGFVAAVGVALSALTLALGWSQLRLRGLIMLSGALVLGAALAYLPWQYSSVRASLPPIHDITT